jgi:hypothetical protein
MNWGDSSHCLLLLLSLRHSVNQSIAADAGVRMPVAGTQQPQVHCQQPLTLNTCCCAAVRSSETQFTQPHSTTAPAQLLPSTFQAGVEINHKRPPQVHCSVKPQLGRHCCTQCTRITCTSPHTWAPQNPTRSSPQGLPTPMMLRNLRTAEHADLRQRSVHTLCLRPSLQHPHDTNTTNSTWRIQDCSEQQGALQQLSRACNKCGRPAHSVAKIHAREMRNPFEPGRLQAGGLKARCRPQGFTGR